MGGQRTRGERRFLGVSYRVVVATTVLLCVCALGVGASTAAAQSGSSSVSVSTLYESDLAEGNEQVRDIVRTDNGGLIALVLADQRETTVVRLDSSGEIVSEETVEGRLESVSQVDTDAYAAAGNRGNTAILTRIHEDGWIEWTERYGGEELDVGFDAVSAPHGDTYLLASTRSFENDTSVESETSNLWVVRVDDEGEPRWDRLISHEKWTAFPQGERLADGSLIATIQTERSVEGEEADGQQNVSAVRLAPDGETMWRTRIVGTGEPIDTEQAFDVVPAHDDGVLLAGGSNSGNDDSANFDTWAVHLDSDGDVVWQRQYDSASRSVANSVTRTANGYLLAGLEFDRRGGREVSARKLTHIDADGTEQASVTFHRSRESRDQIRGVDWLGEDQLAIGGASSVPSGSGEIRVGGWIDAVDTGFGIDPGSSVWETQHSAAEQAGEDWTIEDSALDLMLFGATGATVLLLFVPFGARRIRRRR